MDERKTLTNGPENKKTNDDAYIPGMTSADYMCQKKKEEEDLLALKIALRYRYNDSNTT